MNVKPKYEHFVWDFWVYVIYIYKNTYMISVYKC